jgi:hypothetical protein
MNGTLRGIVIGSVCSTVVLLAATAIAGTGPGSVFNIGATNTVDAQSTLTGNANSGPQLRVVNTNAVNHAILAEAGDGSGIALYGRHASAAGNGPAVKGQSASTAGSAFAVYGVLTSSTPGAGSAAVRGENNGMGADGYGVFGVHYGSGVGVFGKSGAGGTGLYGQSGNGGTGVRGDGRTYGVYGTGATGVQGTSQNGNGVSGSSPLGNGVFGTSTDGAGVLGVSAGENTGNPGVEGHGDHGPGVAGYGGTAGIYGQGPIAGEFHGDVTVEGGYLRVKTVTGGAPPSTDCDQASEAGRIVVRTDGTTNAYVCTGAAWAGLSPPP